MKAWLKVGVAAVALAASAASSGHADAAQAASACPEGQTRWYEAFTPRFVVHSSINTRVFVFNRRPTPVDIKAELRKSDELGTRWTIIPPDTTSHVKTDVVFTTAGQSRRLKGYQRWNFRANEVRRLRPQPEPNEKLEVGLRILSRQFPVSVEVNSVAGKQWEWGWANPVQYSEVCLPGTGTGG